MNKKILFYDLKGVEHSPSDLNKVSFRPTVYIFVKNKKNELLTIIDEISNKREIPGGGVEIGEELYDSCIRELLEETGYKIKLDSDLPFYIEKDMSYYNHKDKFVHSLNMYFTAKLESEIPEKQNFAEDENILEVSFIDINELNINEFVDYQKKAIKKYLNK